jgi:hypothetical protein
MYASNGQFDRAATVMSTIVATRPWRDAVAHYARLGGDVNVVGQADEMQQLFGTPRQNESRVYSRVQWGARADTTAFLYQLQQADYDAARSTLDGMADKITQGDPDAVNPATILHYTDLLLAKDPHSALADESLLASAVQPQFGERSALRNTLTAHGSERAAAASWRDIQTNTTGGRVMYLYFYAGATLAANGVKA